MSKIREFKIKSLGISDREFAKLPFGRQLDYEHNIKEFKKSAKTVHVSQKGRTHAAAMREFKDLYKPKEYFCSYWDSDTVRDDTFPVFYVN